MSDTNPTALTPDHKQEIRERLNSTLAVRKSDAEALLAEADRLRAESDQLYSDLTGAYLDRWEEAQDNIRLRLALSSAQRGRRELRARVAELEARPSRAEVLREAADALEKRVADVDVDTRTTWAGMDAAYLRHMADEAAAPPCARCNNTGIDPEDSHPAEGPSFYSMGEPPALEPCRNCGPGAATS